MKSKLNKLHRFICNILIYFSTEDERTNDSYLNDEKSKVETNSPLNTKLNLENLEKRLGKLRNVSHKIVLQSSRHFQMDSMY